MRAGSGAGGGGPPTAGGQLLFSALVVQPYPQVVLFKNMQVHHRTTDTTVIPFDSILLCADLSVGQKDIL